LFFGCGLAEFDGSWLHPLLGGLLKMARGLHTPAPATTFPDTVCFVVYVFCYSFVSHVTVCLCIAQILLGYLLAWS
jgi:hypothetical protein